MYSVQATECVRWEYAEYIAVFKKDIHSMFWNQKGVRDFSHTLRFLSPVIPSLFPPLRCLSQNFSEFPNCSASTEQRLNRPPFEKVFKTFTFLPQKYKFKICFGKGAWGPLYRTPIPRTKFLRGSGLPHNLHSPPYGFASADTPWGIAASRHWLCLPTSFLGTSQSRGSLYPTSPPPSFFFRGNSEWFFLLHLFDVLCVNQNRQ